MSLTFKIMTIAEIAELSAAISMLYSILQNRSAKGVSLKCVVLTLFSFVLPYGRWLFIDTRKKPLYDAVYGVTIPILTCALAYTIYIITCKHPFKSTYDKKSDGSNAIALAVGAFLMSIAYSLNFYGAVKPVRLFIIFPAFVRTCALIPQSFVFCDHIQKGESVSVGIANWVLFKSISNITRFFCVYYYSVFEGKINSWILVKHVIELVFLLDFLYWNKQQSLKSIQKFVANTIREIQV